MMKRLFCIVFAVLCLGGVMGCAKEPETKTVTEFVYGEYRTVNFNQFPSDFEFSTSLSTSREYIPLGNDGKLQFDKFFQSTRIIYYADHLERHIIRKAGDEHLVTGGIGKTGLIHISYIEIREYSDFIVVNYNLTIQWNLTKIDEIFVNADPDNIRALELKDQYDYIRKTYLNMNSFFDLTYYNL